MIRELLAVVARAALQWALASLLLANGAAFCLIAAAAARLRLGPPCILCARVHRLLCSTSAAPTGDRRDALRLLICDAHLAAVAPPEHGDLGAASKGNDGRETDGPGNLSSGPETHRVVSIGSEICEQDHEDDGQPRAADRRDLTRTSSTGDGNGPLISLFELAPIVARPREDDDSLHPATAPDLPTGDGDERLTIGQLVSELRAQRRELEELRARLDGERRARAEAEEYQRQLEEQGELDREAARLAMQLVHESETEKHGLQQQLDACRVRAQLYNGQDDASREDDGGGGGNYQSLVDFLPGSVYSSSPDLLNLLKLYTEASGGGGGDRHQRDAYTSAVTVVAEEAEEEEVPVAVTAGVESSGSVDTTIAIVGDSLHQRSTDSCHVETVTEAA